MLALGRSLEFFGLVMVPMALIYYFSNRELREMGGESELMFGELTIFAVGTAVFFLGNLLVKRSGGGSGGGGS